jgi:diguanylate cyclase (GGDEF)-like protein
VALFPLLQEQSPVGVFALYAAEPGLFDAQEMKLLIEMAGDISFALDHIAKDEKLNYLAYYDAITGLPNRALFADRLDQRINAARSENQTFSVMLIDVERFRNINETLGRRAGDDLLRQIAWRLKNALEETDVLAHLGGDGFAIATRHINTEADIAHVLDRIFTTVLGQPFEIDGKALRISAKTGIATYPADGTNVESLFGNAEAALRDAKKASHKYLFYAPKMNARVAEKLALENKLRKALEGDEFLLYYQPKIALATGRTCGLEALIRWNDPETGLISPGEFIPVLEDTGMILDVGSWVLRKAIADYQAWRAMGLEPPRIAVNVSPLQLRQQGFVTDVKKAIADGGGMATSIELEITESLIMEEIEKNIQRLNVIKEMGVTIAVDDFGTGYSSLSYIARLPINSLKIDRAFITNMATSPDSMAIVSTIISLAHSLSLKVIAEGVENDEQLKLLRLLRCDEAQGFHFSKPLPPKETVAFLQEQKEESAI